MGVSNAELTVEANADKPPETFGARSIRGLTWLTLQTVGGKGVTILGQIVLAWLLSPADFGLIGLAYTVSSIVGILNNFGIEQVLVHRHRRLDRWANSGFWMSMALGIAAAIMMAAAAPLAARMYREPRLVGLLLILAISAPLGNLIVVPKAKVQSQLRFRFMAVSGFVRALLTMVLTVLCAALGAQAYSFVLPAPLVAIFMAVWYWRAAPSRVSFRLDLRRWKYLFGDSALLFLSGMFYTAIGQGDYFVLGLFYSTVIVGIYYFAFNLSMQAIILFTVNLSNVLFPVLSKLNDDPRRQAAAFMRSTRVLGVVAIPFCLLQAAVAEPLVRLLFDARWQSSVPVLQILSIAMALRVVSWPSGSLMMAQGRFRTRMWLSIVSVAIFFPLVVVGAWWDAAVGTAVAVVLFFAIIMPLNLWVALRPWNIGWRQICQLFLPAFITGLVCLFAAWGGSLWLERYPWGPVPQILLICLIGLALYALCIRKIDPQSWQEMSDRFRPLIKSLRLRKTMG